MERLQYIVQQEAIPYDDEGLQAVHKLSGGDQGPLFYIWNVGDVQSTLIPRPSA
jgi:hypothetical protein